jgi:hypothetical protein
MLPIDHDLDYLRRLLNARMDDWNGILTMGMATFRSSVLGMVPIYNRPLRAFQALVSWRLSSAR